MTTQAADTPETHRSFVWVALPIVYVVWGSTYLGIHFLVQTMPPLVGAGIRFVVASVVLYDADLDIAVLALPDTGVPQLTFDTGAGQGDSVAVLGYPEDGPYTVEVGRIRSQQRLRSPDIYGDGTVIRQVYSLRALIRPGNSGGPIVTSGGEVAGMVFAASVSDKDTGYALTATQVGESAAKGLTRDAPVDTGTCVR